MSLTNSTKVKQYLPARSRRSFIETGATAAFGLALRRTDAGALAEISRTSQFDLRRGDLGNGTFLNPILAGDHPDAGAIRVGNDYYLTHTTFSYTPGLYIWHSIDLVNWTLINAALKKFYGEIWAPYLCEHKGHFYIYFPCSGKLTVVHADSPDGDWSEPIFLGVDGIDPSHIATPEGERYLYFAGGRIIKLSADGLSVEGAARTIMQPWPIPLDWRVECECLEAPKATYRNGYYYLTVAEGGTAGPATSHMVLSARSQNVDGPWEYSPFNPIVHTQSRAERWWSKGHGRLVEAADKSWWMTCHSYENGYPSLGRQLLLLPVEWTVDGWYRVPAGISASQPLPMPHRSTAVAKASAHRENPWPTAGLEWQFWKSYDLTRLRVDGDALVIAAKGDSVATSSVITSITGDHSYTVEVDVEVEPGCDAGLILFYDEKHFVGFNLGLKGLEIHPHGSGRIQASRATVRIVNDDQEADFYYRLPGKEWTKFRSSMDITSYNNNALGGFLDLRPALYSCGSGHASFRAYRYQAGAIKP